MRSTRTRSTRTRSTRRTGNSRSSESGRWWGVRPLLVGLGLALGAVACLLFGFGFLVSVAFGGPQYMAFVGIVLIPLGLLMGSRVRFFFIRGWRRLFPPDPHLNVLYHDRH